MGALLGDVFVGLRVGTRYTLGVRKIGPEREGGEFLGIITQDRLTSATGQQYSGDAPLWPLMAGVDIDETVERGDEFISTFIVPEGYGKWAHRLLPLAVQGTANDERMDWLSIMRSEHFAHPFSEFENAFDEWISQGFADFVGRIVPQNAPLFLDGVDLGRPTPERRHQRR